MTTLTVKSLRKVADFVPSRPCKDSLYCPVYVNFRGKELLYLLGGHDDAPQAPGLADPNRGADRVYVCERLPTGEWGPPQLIIDRTAFPWQKDEAFLRAHPEAFVSSMGQFQVAVIGNEVHGFMDCCVNDENVCTGEHTGSTEFGPCDRPWSYGAMFHFVSSDGVNDWKLVEHADTGSTNRALQAAMMYYEPSSAEAPGEFGGFKGIRGVRMAHLALDGWLYLWLEFWCSGEKDEHGNVWIQRNVLTRVHGDVLPMQVWNGSGWEDFRSKLPQWVNKHTWQGNPCAYVLSHVTRAYDLEPAAKYMGLTPSGDTNAVMWLTSDNLTTWSERQIVQSSHPTIEGTGAANTFMNPFLAHRSDGRYSVFGGSTDWNGDGKPDCPEGDYIGIAPFEGEITSDAKPVVIVPPLPPPPPPVPAARYYELRDTFPIPGADALVAEGAVRGVDHTWLSVYQTLGDTYWTYGKGQLAPSNPPPNPSGARAGTWRDLGAIA